MRTMLLVVLVATVALVSGTTLVTAEEQSAEDKAVPPPEERRAPKGGEGSPCKSGYQRDSTGVCLRLGDYGSTRRRRGRWPLPCLEYDIDATGQRGKCLMHQYESRPKKRKRGVLRRRGPGRRCEPGYQRDSTGTCQRLGSF